MEEGLPLRRDLKTKLNEKDHYAFRILISFIQFCC